MVNTTLENALDQQEMEAFESNVQRCYNSDEQTDTSKQLA